MSVSSLILVARLVAPHGVNGAISADCYSDAETRFVPGSVLLAADGRRFTVRQASMHKGRLLLYFDGLADRDAADKLRGLELFVDEADSPPLPAGSYYHYQLLGLKVYQGDELLGTLADILSYAANDVYVIKDDAGHELLLPALKSFVLEVNLPQHTMQVIVPEGLR